MFPPVQPTTIGAYILEILFRPFPSFAAVESPGGGRPAPCGICSMCLRCIAHSFSPYAQRCNKTVYQTQEIPGAAPQVASHVFVCLCVATSRE